MKRVVSSTLMLEKRPGTPMTINELKTLDPKTLPKATSGLPFIAALTETISSGKEVPTATAKMDIIPTAILSNSEIPITETIKYFDEKVKKITLKKSRLHSLKDVFGFLFPFQHHF